MQTAKSPGLKGYPRFQPIGPNLRRSQTTEWKKQRAKPRKKGEGISQNEKEKIKGIQDGTVTKTITKKTGKEKEQKVEASKECLRKRLQAKIDSQAAEEETRAKEETGKGERTRK